MMRVALVGNYPPPNGGVAVHVAALARFLRGRGVEVRVLDIGRGDHREGDVRPARGTLRYARELSLAAARGFLLHTHTSGANPKSWLVALAAGRVRRPFGARGVLTLHSGLSPAYLAGSPERRHLARAACLAHGRVVAVSAEIAGALAQAGVPRAQILVLPAYSQSLLAVGQPPPGFAPVRAAHAPLFCAALSHGRTYGEDLLGAAFAAARERLPRAGLVVFGPGSGEGRLARAAREHALGGAIHVLGELPHPAALAVMRGCDVFVRATRADGDALSVREALALGRTVVASAVGHRPPGCLLFAPGDAAALAEKMIEAGMTDLLPPPSPSGRGKGEGGSPGAVPVPGARDPFERLLALYRSLWEAGPLSSGGRPTAGAPTLWP